MFYRLKQAFRALFAKPSEKDKTLALDVLKAPWEQELFSTLSPYDQNHSLRILKEILEYEKSPSLILKRLALLHDVGKHPSLTLLDRALYSKFKISRKEIGKHPYLGYLKVKLYDAELAELIVKHHSMSDDSLIKRFQYYDNRN